MPLNPDVEALQLYHKAKQLHWDPAALDLTRDRADWAALDDREQGAARQLCSLFLVGEAAVTHDLAPLLIGLRRRGDREEALLFLAAQLYEEAKHTEFFDRWLNTVAAAGPPEEFLSPAYETLFHQRLPNALNRCLEAHDPLTLARASATYHLIVEGVMAETGYHVFATALASRGLFPALLEGVAHVQQDEGRHLAFGLSLIRSLLREAPEIRPPLMADLYQDLALATTTLQEAFAIWEGDVPFGLDPNEAIEFASRQFSRRLAALERPE